MRQVYLSLLRMYLSPPSIHCLGPIKLELLEPQANLQAALQVLELHHSKLDTTKVRGSLLGRWRHLWGTPKEKCGWGSTLGSCAIRHLLASLCSPLCFCPQALNLLPANTQINDIRIFLEKVLEENAQKKRFNQVLKNLLHAEFLRVRAFQPVRQASVLLSGTAPICPI